MSRVLSRRVALPKMSRFGWLMGLYSENHARLQRLFEPAQLGMRDVRVVDRRRARRAPRCRRAHAYTTELRMSYDLVDPQTGLADPSASLRVYSDARQVEATHCYAGRRWQDVIGMYPPPERILDHRLRMNTFLGKWVQYLAEQGHGVATLRPMSQDEIETGA
jgi:uncharacterized protein YqiB (DUF1249 family)